MTFYSAFAEWVANNGVLIAGGSGGLVRWGVNFRETHFVDGVFGVVVGAICSRYLAPVLYPWISEKWFGIAEPTPDAVYTAGFIIGLGGMTVASFIIRKWANIEKKEKADGDA